MVKVWHTILIAMIRPWQYLPLGFHYAWGAFLSGLMRVFRYRKDVALINLSRSFPELKYKEIRKIEPGPDSCRNHVAGWPLPS